MLIGGEKKRVWPYGVIKGIYTDVKEGDKATLWVLKFKYCI